MLLDEFDFPLPSELIALDPPAERSGARLMILPKGGGGISESKMVGFPELLMPGDLLVFNDTKVIPARLRGEKTSGGRVEIFLVRRLDSMDEEWIALIRASKAPKPGAVILLSGGVSARVIGRHEVDEWLVVFSGVDDFMSWLEHNGSVPLPPYIKRAPQESDRDRYQTVFARERGAVAAPTAGLHFTDDLLGEIRCRGVDIATVTLHVGLGTFMPVRVTDPTLHRMHKERFCIPAETSAAIALCRRRSGRVIAVGTTVARTLEHAAEGALVQAGSGEADIFIYPGYRFKVIDGLLTNFHLPKSTLLMLVSALAGRERVLDAYGEAVRRGFRFFSYGDAMFIG